MTRGAVRCSAWLGVRSDLRQRWRVAAKRRVKVRAVLRSAASGRLGWSADGNAAEGGWGVGRKLPAMHTDARTDGVERRGAVESESQADDCAERVDGLATKEPAGVEKRIAAKVATWPKPGNTKLSKSIAAPRRGRHASHH